MPQGAWHNDGSAAPAREPAHATQTRLAFHVGSCRILIEGGCLAFSVQRARHRHGCDSGVPASPASLFEYSQQEPWKATGTPFLANGSPLGAAGPGRGGSVLVGPMAPCTPVTARASRRRTRASGQAEERKGGALMPTRSRWGTEPVSAAQEGSLRQFLRNRCSCSDYAGIFENARLDWGNLRPECLWLPQTK